MRAIIFAVWVFLASGSVASARNLSTQRQVNELAARLIDAREALSGLTGSPHPGEDTAHYQNRIRGYLRALDRAAHDSAQIHAAEHKNDAATWKRMEDDSLRFKDEVAQCHTIWEKQMGYASGGRKLGQAIAKALQTLQSVLNGLRDARP